jgi:hypothetical protein
VNPNSAAIVDLLRIFFADIHRYPRWPKPLHLIQGALLVDGGADVETAARFVGTTAARLLDVVTGHDPVETALRIRDQDITSDAVNRLRRKVGELVLGRAAEIAFEDICNGEMNPREFSMTDVRHGRTNTDFRLLNGGARPLYRFNVKLFPKPMSGP